MKVFSVQEIIEYAIKIEKESFEFYTRAAKKVEAGDVNKLLVQLSGEEIDHQNRLKALIHEGKVSRDTLLKEMEVDTTVMDRIVQTSVIPEDAEALDVLTVALEREKNTEQTYAMLSTLSHITDDIIKVFEDLRLQEVGHANKIQARIDKL